MSHLHPRALAVGVVAACPSVVLAHGELQSLVLTACVLTALCSSARFAMQRLAPNLGRRYLFARLFSFRYLVPALGLPIVCAACIATWGAWTAVPVIALHSALARRYAARFERPGAAVAALLPAALGGFFCALEWLAVRGPEWRLGGKLLYAEESHLQRVVLVERAGSIDLLIDGELQFRSSDEHLYHEGLVAPVLASAAREPSKRLHVLIMGGGDGLAARDLLKCTGVERVTIVDWDPTITRLFRSEPQLVARNEGALLDPRVEIIHRDIRDVLAEKSSSFHAVIGDLTDPDPRAFAAHPLGAPAFCASVRQRLSADGLFVTHASTLDGTSAAQLLRAALEAASFNTSEYSREIPSFGSITYVVGTLGVQPMPTLPRWARRELPPA